MSFCGEHDEHRINDEGIRMGLDPAFSAWVPCVDYQERAKELAQMVDRVTGLLRDVMVDFVPWCTRADGDCECSANRARRYLLANGVDL